MQRQNTRTDSREEEDLQWEDDQPEMVASRQQLRDHQPDAYTTGYDSTGDTRVGIGTGGGDLERLVRMNEGRHQSDGSHSAREAARDKKRVTESFCSALDVTSYQQRESISIMGQLNLDRFGRQKRIEKVALCAIKVIVERDRERWFLDGRDPAEIDLSTVQPSDFPSKIAHEPLYQSLCDQHSLSDRDRFSITQLVKRELKRIGYFERANQTFREEGG